MFYAIALLAQANTVSAAAVPAEAPADVGDALSTMAGEWTGKLEYRDYRSNDLAAIPMRADIEIVPDGVTMIQRLRFSDPGVEVYTTNIVSINGTTISTAASRAGRAFECYEQTARLVEAGSDHSWTISTSQIGRDDNRPAAIRETTKLRGNQLTITKEIDFLDDNETRWEFRNRVTLDRQVS